MVKNAIKMIVFTALMVLNAQASGETQESQTQATVQSINNISLLELKTEQCKWRFVCDELKFELKNNPQIDLQWGLFFKKNAYLISLIAIPFAACGLKELLESYNFQLGTDRIGSDWSWGRAFWQETVMLTSFAVCAYLLTYFMCKGVGSLLEGVERASISRAALTRLLKQWDGNEARIPDAVKILLGSIKKGFTLDAEIVSKLSDGNVTRLVETILLTGKLMDLLASKKEKDLL